MTVRLKLKPGQPGTKKLAALYGDKVIELGLKTRIKTNDAGESEE